MSIKKLIQHFSGYGLGKFIPFRLLKDKPSSWCEYEGIKLYIGEEDNAGYSTMDFEWFERKKMKEQIKKGDVVIDIGANIGFYTCLFSKWVGENGRVYAFEPEQKNYKILQENIKRNNCNNVICFNYAISNESGIGKLFIHKNLGEHSMSDKGIKEQIIDVKRLDEIYIGKIDFIKMDIEGWEARAFNGMSKILKENPNIKIFSEFYPRLINKSGITSEEYLRLIKNRGFKIEWINKNKKIKKLEIDSLDSTNFLGVRT